MESSQRVVVMAADYGYINNAMTTIKSLLFNNGQVTIYLINSDIPQEWFEVINSNIKPIGDQLNDVKINPDLLKDEHISQNHLSPIAYGKLLIPDLISEDHVVYIDSDVIVDDDISDLFDLTFDDGKLFAAAHEMEGSDNYNDGILVVNNRQLKKIPHLTDDLLKYGGKKDLHNSDQSVFNDYFAGKIMTLPLTDNYEVGMDRWAFVGNRQDMLDKLASVNHPRLIHYVTDDKPWNFTSSSRYRDKWWQYYGLDWGQLRDWHRINSQFNGDVIQPVPPRVSVGSLFTMTNSQDIECLENLVRALPQWDFNIAAYTWMGWNLNRMVEYPNVHIYPIITGVNIDRLIKKSAAYLDINYGSKDDNLLNVFGKTGKPMFTFADVSSHLKLANYHEFETGACEELKQAIEQLNN